MAETLSTPKLCTFFVAILEYSGDAISISYGLEERYERIFALYGRVKHEDGRFRNKRVDIRISSAPIPEFMVRTADAVGVGGAPGLCWIQADLEFTRHMTAPVSILLHVGDDLFNALLRRAAEASDRCEQLSACVTLFGEPLPDGRQVVNLDELDVSVEREYVIGAFELSGGTRDPLRGRGNPRAPHKGPGASMSFSMLLLAVEYEIDIESGLVKDIECEGRILGSRSWKDCSVDISFVEDYSSEWKTAALAEGSAFGWFRYVAPSTSETRLSGRFALQLRCAPGDIARLLLPQLTQDSRTEVIVSATLEVGQAELLAVTDEIQGDVRSWTTRVSRNFGTTT